MTRHADPEQEALARQEADRGEFEIAIIHEEHGELGTLDKTYNNEYDATMAEGNARIPDVGITTEIRDISDDETAGH